jgi:HK97 family phage major capsid protein
VRLLEDAATSIEQLMAELLGEAFASAEGVAFLTGNGVKRPFGLMVSPTLPKIASGNATAVTADCLIDASTYLKSSYTANSVWMMNRNTFGQLRKLKNTVGDYLFSEGNILINSSPVTLIGRPVLMSPSMPNVAAAASLFFLPTGGGFTVSWTRRAAAGCKSYATRSRRRPRARSGSTRG